VRPFDQRFYRRRRGMRIRISDLRRHIQSRSDVETICMGKTKSQILTLLQNWHRSPILAASNSGTPSISGVPGGRSRRPSLDKPDAVLENSCPVWLRFPLASPRARAPSDVYLAIGVFKKLQPGWQRIHLRPVSSSWVKSRARRSNVRDKRRRPW